MKADDDSNPRPARKMLHQWWECDRRNSVLIAAEAIVEAIDVLAERMAAAKGDG